MGALDLSAVVFDMDGVLIDSEPLWQDAEIELFGTVGVELTREQCRRTMGLRIDEVVAYWYATQPWPGPTERDMTDSIVARVVELVSERGRLLPGVELALETVTGLGLRTALASSSYRPIVDAVMDELGLRTRFEVVVSGDEEPAGKPDPGLYLRAARSLKEPPRRCVAVEDSPNGVRAARAAGMRCVAIRTPHASEEELADADLILSSLVDLDEEAFVAVAQKM